jgi:hypothetical protein
MRRCNLACTYCNEFDDYSARSGGGNVLAARPPEFGTHHYHDLGRRTRCHPDLDLIITRVRSHGMIAGR